MSLIGVVNWILCMLKMDVFVVCWHSEMNGGDGKLHSCSVPPNSRSLIILVSKNGAKAHHCPVTLLLLLHTNIYAPTLCVKCKRRRRRRRQGKTKKKNESHTSVWQNVRKNRQIYWKQIKAIKSKQNFNKTSSKIIRNGFGNVAHKNAYILCMWLFFAMLFTLSLFFFPCSVLPF